MESMPYIFAQADATCLPLSDNSVDLTVTSSPYVDARTYGIGAQRNCEEWIEFMLPVVHQMVRVTKGPVILNCAGVQRDRCYWPACEGLLYRAWKAGVECYRPAYWNRRGIPGSGGTDWLRADTEYCLCFKKPGALPHFDVSQVGHKPKWGPGGEMSHRLSAGTRVNQWGRPGSGCGRRPDGSHKKQGSPSHLEMTLADYERSHTKGDASGDLKEQRYTPPKYANPGNVLRGNVGGGHLGHPLAHDNEAPYPEYLPEFFIKGWSKPGDTVLDPFSGSGTTVAVANRLGRIGIGFDIRMSQCELGRRRLANPVVKPVKKTRKPKIDPGSLRLFDEAA